MKKKLLIVLLLIVGIVLVGCGKKDKEEKKEEPSPYNYAVGNRDRFLYLISPTLEETRIYKIASYYSYEYIVVDDYAYVMYHDIEINENFFIYTDVIDLSTGKVTKVTAKDLKNSNEDITVYYYKYIDGELYVYYQNLKDKEEHVYEGDIPSIFDRHDSIQKDDKTLIKTDGQSVYINEENILSLNDEGDAVSSLYLVNDNVLQIQISTLKYSPSWTVDRYYYYFFDSKDLRESKTGFTRIDNSTCKKTTALNIEDDTNNDDEEFDIAVIDADYSLTKHRVKDILNKQIDENKLLEIIGISQNDFNNFKKKFTTLNMEELKSYDDDKEKNSQSINNHFKALEQLIYLSDTNSIEKLKNEFKGYYKSKYGDMVMALLSGIINYYIGEPINSIEIDDVRQNESMPYQGEIDFILNGKYAIIYSFDTDDPVNFYTIIYKDVKYFDDIYNDYNKYENNNNTYLCLSINSYDYSIYLKALLSRFKNMNS